MSDDTAIFVGASDADQFLLLKYANRHGLIAGATGTGKTVTLQTIAEGFSAYGVPVFMADVKGDLSGVGQMGGDNPRAIERAKQLKIEGYAGRAFPTIYWDLFGEKGHPVRTTVTEIGPVLMARLLQLNATQEGVLNIVFKVADEQSLLLLDFKDLQSVLQWTAENAGSLTTKYGNVSKQTVGTIQRSLLTLEQQGGERFFGEPALDLKDMIGRDASGAGYINILAADKLMQSPRLYATFLLWLLSELFEVMPEIGDADRPKFVFFFDEAHLLFDDAPKALLDKIEQVVRLIRSKGVGVYFITQNPLDIPESVLGQLSNRVQHALARLHAEGPEGGEDRGRHVPSQQEVQRRRGHPRAGRRRGAGLVPRRQGRARAGRALLHRAAARPHRPGDRGRARGCDQGEPACRQSTTARWIARSAYEVLNWPRRPAGQVEHDEAAARPASPKPARPVRCSAPAVSAPPGPWGPRPGSRRPAPARKTAPPPPKPPGAHHACARGIRRPSPNAPPDAGKPQRFDRHDGRQGRDGAYRDQRRWSREVRPEAVLQGRRLDPARRAGLADREVAVEASTIECSIHVLVAAATEDVAKKVKLPGLSGQQRYARLLAGHDVGAHAEVAAS